MEQLRLRPVQMEEEHAVLEAHRSLANSDSYDFLLHYESEMAWPQYVTMLSDNARGVNLANGLVANTFLLAQVANQIVGRASIRHELNDFLAHEGGHIGYAVLEGHRGRGYASEILRQSLIIAASLGVESALLTCDDANLASARVIERCGGVYRDQVIDRDGSPTRRYDIALVG